MILCLRPYSAGVIPPILAGYSLAIAGQEMADIGLTVMYIGPIIGSLYASEKWRKPPQARRVSLSLCPTPNGGLSAVTTRAFLTILRKRKAPLCPL